MTDPFPFPTSPRPTSAPTADLEPRHPEKPVEKNEQAPLGPHPTYDDVLDVAVEYTFPASDPVAVDSCCADLRRKEPRQGPAGSKAPDESDDGPSA
jgi:hypothetical protein